MVPLDLVGYVRFVDFVHASSRTKHAGTKALPCTGKTVFDRESLHVGVDVQDCEK